ncbi:MAG: sugar ABC transporter permease [Elainella sp. C42_A2020_010]|nr:sugar ABC transporter permease [Elainella sp. C42_A2020_010]
MLSKLKTDDIEKVNGYLFLAPALLVLGVFMVLPIFYTLFLCFHKVQLLGAISYEFVGWRNFARLLQDHRFWIALRNTAEYVIIVVPLQTILALLLAVTLNSGIKGQNGWRVIYFLPTVTASAVLTLIFMWIYNTNGLLNQVLATLSLPTYNWLRDPDVALKGIMLMNIWSTAPLYMMIYLAALQEIPRSLYEAAQIDGASAWEQFSHITLPLLKPVTFFIVTMGIIGTFQLFDQAYIFSNGSGGPNNSTLTIVLLIYQYVFRDMQLGYAAVVTAALMLLIILATILQRQLFKSNQDSV